MASLSEAVFLLLGPRQHIRQLKDGYLSCNENNM
jgi:hypothetical protein